MSPRNRYLLEAVAFGAMLALVGLAFWGARRPPKPAEEPPPVYQWQDVEVELDGLADTIIREDAAQTRQRQAKERDSKAPKSNWTKFSGSVLT